MTSEAPPCHARPTFVLRSYYEGIRQMDSVSDQDMNTYLAEVSRVCAYA